VPHFAPNENPFVDEFIKLYNLPREAVLGYPETRVSGVPQEDQRHVRAAASVHCRLRCCRQLRQAARTIIGLRVEIERRQEQCRQTARQPVITIAADKGYSPGYPSQFSH
jgi:hypothetical protein